MPSFNELGNQYFARLINSITPEREFLKILSEIKGLVYSGTNIPLSDEDRAKIVELIISNFKDLKKGEEYSGISGPPTLLEHKEIVKCFSNDNYLDLISFIKDKMKG